MANPTYTHKTPPVSGANEGEQTNFGGQAMDANRIAMGQASGFVTQDATASPVVSPVTVSSSNTVINVPSNAVSMTVLNTGATNALTVSEATSGHSFQLNTGQSISFPLARQGVVYLNSASGSTASFYFALID